MESVWFEDEYGNVFHPEEHGLILKYFDAPPPNPKIYRVNIDGADGSIDMTEWAGIIRYNNRDVQVAFRDMESTGYHHILNFLHGRKIKITYSENVDYYLIGRCENAEQQERKHITDIGFQFVCEPYRLRQAPTIISKSVSGLASIMLKAEKRPVTPTITVDSSFVIAWGNRQASIEPGTYTLPELLVTDVPQTITATGTGTITLKWRDGVL